MSLLPRVLTLVALSGSLIAFVGFASTIDTRLRGNLRAERAQDLAMFGGIGAAIPAAILVALLRRRA